MAIPSRPIDAYKALIDELVNETSRSLAAKTVAKKGAFRETSDYAVFNDLISSLAPQRRRLLSQMLEQERIGAIHDVLALLTASISPDGVGLTFQGEPMPVELSGMGLHGDYIGRRNGWEWPDDGDPTAG
jgi:hypothetical protein